MSALTKKTIHTTFRARAIDDVQSPEPDALCLRKGDVVVVTEIEAVGRAYGARYDGKRGWFPLDQVIDEPPSSPRSPRSGSSISPRSLNSSGSSVSTSPGGSSGGSGISREAPSPTSTRNQPKPAARKISSFLWKTREERQNEILGGGAVAAALASIAQEEPNQNQGLVEEKSLKKPSDIIKLRLMRRKSVSDKPIAAAAQRRSEFGVTIEELAGRDSAVRGLPYVVFVSVAHLIEHALDLEGIFRISVSYPDLLEMKDMLETGLPRLLDSQASCHAVAATLKQFFRELPDPLLTFALYDKWMNTGELQNLDERKQKLIALIKELPEANQRTLHFLMTFLKVVSLHSEVNKMSTLNLGVVFAPSILRRKVETKDDFMRMETQRGIVETFLDDYEEVFPQLFPQGEKEANQGSWTEERLLDLLRPTEKETAQLRRVSGSGISGTVQKEESPSEAYIREHSPGATSSGSGVDSRMLSSMDQLSPVQPSSSLKEKHLAVPGAKEGSSDSEGEEEKKESKKKSRSRSNTTDKSRKEEREKRKREKAERKEEKRKEKEKDKEKDKEKKEKEKEKDKAEKKEKNKGKDKENKDTDKDQTKDREKDKDNDENKDEGSKKRGSVVFMKEAPPARAVASGPVRRSESPKEMRRRAVTASGSFLSPVENGSDMKKRSLVDSTDALSLSRSDESMSAHLETLRNESRAIELEIENKRLEWTWLEQEKQKLSEAVAALTVELDMKRKERAMLEEENKKLKSKNDALIVSEVYSSDEEEEEDA